MRWSHDTEPWTLMNRCHAETEMFSVIVFKMRSVKVAGFYSLIIHNPQVVSLGEDKLFEQ